MGTCPGCGLANPDRARFCQECGTALPSTADANEVRKVVTVLFTDVVGSTALGERLDAEAIRAVMARYFDLARNAAESHGGTVEKFIGDAVMAVFGIPQLHEDDAIRAIRAATEIRRSLRELNLELEERHGVHLETRTGINTGEVIAGLGGQTLVTGDAVNTAARLEQAAEPGAIVIGELTYRLARDWITATQLEPLPAKGKAEPVPAYVVERVTDVRHEAVSPVGRIVGRQQELGDLLGRFDRAVRTRSVSLVTLLAQPGVGKSRVLRELLTRLPAATNVIQGRCIPYGDAARYWPIREALRNAAGIADGDTAQLIVDKLSALAAGDPQARAIGQGVASLMGVAGVSASQDEGFWAARRLLERVAQASPLVAVFEDLHWADGTFLDLLEYISDLGSDAPVLIVTTARPELMESKPGWGAGRENAHMIRLEPLADVDIRTLCRGQDGADALPEVVVDRIVRSAEGNPLYVEQIVAMLREDGAGMTDAGVPPTVRALIASRLDRLPADARRVAEHASVIGRVFETSALAHVAPSRLDASVTQHLLTLVRRELIRPTRADLGTGDAYAFRHALIRDAAYAALPKRERAEIHERLADWLEEHVGSDLAQYQELIAHHLEQATRYRASLGHAAARSIARRAADHLAQVGGRSLAGGAVRHAAAVLRRAMDLAGDA
jgi:class 3 adenylate cyclase